MWVRYGTFDLWAGKINAKDVTNAKYGSAVGSEKGTVFNMYGGKITGGKVTTNGATLYLRGTLNMLGGVIENGNSTTGSTGYAGNVYIGSTGVMNMYGGTITGGKASRHGGNISTETNSAGTGGAVLNMYGGTIEKGNAGVNGGNILVAKAVKFTMYGGTVSDGTAQGCGGNIATNPGGIIEIKGGTVKNGKAVQNSDYGRRSQNIFCNAGTIKMSGGTVEGYTELMGAFSAEFSGKANISGKQYNLFVPNGGKITLGTLEKGAALGINSGASVDTIIISDSCQKDAADFVTSDKSGYKIAVENGKLVLKKSS